MPIMVMETDLLIVGALLLVFIISTGLGFRYWWNIRNNAPEANIFLKSRKRLHPLPIMRIADTDGNGFLALGETDQKGDISFKFPEAGGIQVNPKLQGITPEDKINGIPFYNYSTQFPFPLSARNSQAFKSTLDYARKTFPQLEFITDVRLMELIALPANELEYDCNNVIETHEQENMTASGFSYKVTAKDLASAIKNIQAQSHTIPISKGFYSYRYAFERVPSSILSQDIHQLKLLVKRQTANDMTGSYEKYIPLGIFAMLVCAGVAILFMLKGGN